MSVFDYERNRWNDEVATEAARLVREGTHPMDASRRANEIVQDRRRNAARQQRSGSAPLVPAVEAVVEKG